MFIRCRKRCCKCITQHYFRTTLLMPINKPATLEICLLNIWFYFQVVSLNILTVHKLWMYTTVAANIWIMYCVSTGVYKPKVLYHLIRIQMIQLLGRMNLVFYFHFIYCTGLVIVTFLLNWRYIKVSSVLFVKLKWLNVCLLYCFSLLICRHEDYSYDYQYVKSSQPQ